jgi:predicted glutamine amidotransferase
MCGILGFYIPTHKTLDNDTAQTLLTRLFQFSETRGKEAAGLAMASDDKIMLIREALSASKMVALPSFREEVRSFLQNSEGDAPISAIGHARLATNGWQDKISNNQPVSRDGIVLIHNGIVVNDQELWRTLGLTPETELDSEIIAACIASAMVGGSSPDAGAAEFFSRIEGNASIAFVTTQDNILYLATNNASIYYSHSEDILVFASERLILEQTLADSKVASGLPAMSSPKRLPNNQPMVVFSDNGKLCLHMAGNRKTETPLPFAASVPRYRKIEDISRYAEDARDSMKRCTHCVLPATMPFITFDGDGVCNYCHSYETMKIAGIHEALKAVAPYKKADGTPDCLVMLSGGRDSCYGLHYAVKELGLTPIAYTYDWGMVTDIARRNASRLCGALGIEHIIVAADIAWKRGNVRKNLMAWLKKPELGMVPILMAGDKQYFYYAEQVRRTNNLPLTLISENPMELSRFKAGFCGVNEAGKRIYNISKCDKIKLLAYYGKQYAKNLRYINSTLLDTLFAFFASYIMEHNLFHIFQYERWEEEKINATLQTLYGWEVDPGAKSTWRIGDGTAAFYNYIYYTMAGITENDTLRSNQIREGMMDRTAALEAVRRENQPRWDSMEWYARTIGFNLVEALLAINQAPKLYLERNSAI